MMPTSPASSRTESAAGLSSIDAKAGIEDLAFAASVEAGAFSAGDLALLHRAEMTLQADLTPDAMSRCVLEGALALAHANDGMLLTLDAQGFLRGTQGAGRANGADAAELAARVTIRVAGSSDIRSATVAERRCFVVPAQSPQDDEAAARGAGLPAALPEVLRRGPLATVPLVAGARVIGVLALGARPAEEALRLIRSFADCAARAIQRAVDTDALRASHGRFREIVEQSTDGIAETSLDGHVLYCNDALLRLLRVSREEMMKRNARSWYVNPDQRDEMLKLIDQRGRVEGMDVAVRRTDGAIVQVNASLRLCQHDGTTILRSIAGDVSERHEIERRLRLLANAVTCAADAIITLDASCHILSWNKGGERILGYTAEEIIGRPYTVLVPPDRLAEFQNVIRVKVEAHGHLQDFETRRLHKDGRQIPVSVTVTRINSGDPAADGWSAVLRDISDRRRDERRRNLLSSITEQSPDAILSVDRDGLVTSWNRGAERIFSIAAPEILGKSWLTLAPPDRESEYRAMMADGRATGAVSIDTFARTRTGSLLPVKLSCSPLESDGNGQDGWSLILRDLSEQRTLAEVSERLREELYSRNRLEGIVGDSADMDEVRERIRRVSRFNSSVLLVGESGTGKEVVANAIHYNSPRREKPFIKVNCAAIPESLLESELFGIERNVATGVDGRIGRFEMADGGTLFLDEIGDMSIATQAKILRVLQEREFERVGGKCVIKVDVRIIAATNKSLEKEIEARRFRNDLYYRLNVIVIALPPLAARREDIDPLVDHFLEKFTRENGLQRRQLTLQARMLLNQYDWPGNVRELEHCIERAVVMSLGHEIVEADLPPAILIWKELGGDGQASGEHNGLSAILRQVERRTVLNALERSGWVQARAARVLGISERSMWYRVKKLGLKQT